MDKAQNVTCANSTTIRVVSIDANCDLFLNVIATTSLCFVGFLGNSVTIAVLRRDRDPQRQKSTNWLLEMLAIADIIFLVFAFIFLLITSLAFNSEALPVFLKVFPYLYAYIYPFATIAYVMTIWIVVLVTVDRYLAINSLLIGLPKTRLAPLQSVLNAAARMIARLPPYSHISDYMINELHW